MNAEKSVLGSILFNNDCMLEIADFLLPVHFTAQNENIYTAIQTLYSSNLPIDVLTVWEQIKKQGDADKVTMSYLSELSCYEGNATNHAKIVIEDWLKRESAKIYEIGINNIVDGKDIFETIEDSQTKLCEITEVIEKKKGNEYPDIGTITLKHIEEASKGDISNLGVKTGFCDIDSKMICLPNSELIIVAARPSMGKSSFMNNVAKNAAAENYVAIFSMEMSAKQLYIRSLVEETGFPYHKIFSGKLNGDEKAEILRTKAKLDKLKLHIDDSSALSMLDVQTKARRLKKKHNVKMIMLDYIQLMKGKGQNRNQEIESITQGLKSLAKELDVPVVALSQLNRGLESRSDKTPMLADLRDSGAIEQDADAVLFLYRPEVYGVQFVDENVRTENLAQVIVAKQRNGPVGKINLTFIKECMRFENYADMF